MLGQEPRLELAGAVARDLNLDLGVVGLDPLRRRAIARVGAVAPGRAVLLIAKQVGQLALQRMLDESLAQVFEEVFNLARRLALGEQLIEQLGVEGGRLLLGLNGHG